MEVLRKAPARDIVTESPLEFILSTADRDRHGDVIDVNGWNLTEFRKNPIALLNHNPDIPIGQWQNVEVDRAKGQLRGHLKLAPAGTSPRLDEIRKLIHARILRSASVGFIPEEQIPFGKGVKYTRCRLLETSVVSIPSNASAELVEARKIEALAIGIKPNSVAKIFRQNVNATLDERMDTAKRRAELAHARRINAELRSYDDLTVEEIVAIELADRAAAQKRNESMYAHHRSNAFDNSPVDLTFHGKPMYRKVGPFGW